MLTNFFVYYFLYPSMHICLLSVPTDRQTLLGVSFRFLILILKVSQPSPLGGMGEFKTIFFSATTKGRRRERERKKKQIIVGVSQFLFIGFNK